MDSDVIETAKTTGAKTTDGATVLLPSVADGVMTAHLAQVLSEAADSAVDSVVGEVLALGATQTQARAVRDAIKLVLLKPHGYHELARSVLMEGGFINGNVDKMLNKIESGVGV